MTFVIGRSYFLWVLSGFFGAGSVAQASSLLTCPQLLGSVPQVILELIELRRELNQLSGPMRAALKDEWQDRISLLDPDQRELLLATVKSGQFGEISQRPVTHDQSRRADQQQRLGWLTDRSRRVRFLPGFDFYKFREGYSDSSLLSMGRDVIEKAGIQFSRDGNLAVVNDAESDNLLVNLQSGQQNVIPGKGRLTPNGRFVISNFPTSTVTNSNVQDQFNIHVVNSGKSFTVTGRPLVGPGFASLRGVLALRFMMFSDPLLRVEQIYTYYSLKTGEPVPYMLGTDIAVGSSGRYIAFKNSDNLKIFDTWTEQMLPLPPELQNAKSVGFPRSGHAMDYDFIQFEKPGGLRNLFRKQSLFLNLLDLIVHQASNHKLKTWKYIQGSRLIFKAYHDMEEDQGYVTFRSPGNAGVDEKVKIDLVHFDDDLQSVRVGNQAWVLVVDHLVMQNMITGDLTALNVGYGHWQIHQQGFLYKKTDDELVIHDILKNVVHRIPRAQIMSRITLTADRQAILTVHPIWSSGPTLDPDLGPIISQTSVHELRLTNLMTKQSVSATSAYADFSFDGQWLAVERGGALEIHEIGPDLGQSP